MSRGFATKLFGLDTTFSSRPQQKMPPALFLEGINTTHFLPAFPSTSQTITTMSMNFQKKISLCPLFYSSRSLELTFQKRTTRKSRQYPASLSDPSRLSTSCKTSSLGLASLENVCNRVSGRSACNLPPSRPLSLPHSLTAETAGNSIEPCGKTLLQPSTMNDTLFACDDAVISQKLFFAASKVKLPLTQIRLGKAI